MVESLVVDCKKLGFDRQVRTREGEVDRLYLRYVDLKLPRARNLSRTHSEESESVEGTWTGPLGLQYAVTARDSCG